MAGQHPGCSHRTSAAAAPQGLGASRSEGCPCCHKLYGYQSSVELGLLLVRISAWVYSCTQRGEELQLNILVALNCSRKTRAKQNERAPSLFVLADPIWKSTSRESSYPASSAAAWTIVHMLCGGGGGRKGGHGRWSSFFGSLWKTN